MAGSYRLPPKGGNYRIGDGYRRPTGYPIPASDPRPPYNRPVGVEDHRKTAVTGVRCAVLTISDTRAPETDVSGRTIVELLEAAGHVVAKRQILRDDPKDVHEAVLGQVGGVDAIITTGGTGITSRDSTYEAIAELLEKRLDGFGELFRIAQLRRRSAAPRCSRAPAPASRAARRSSCCRDPKTPSASA